MLLRRLKKIKEWKNVRSRRGYFLDSINFQTQFSRKTNFQIKEKLYIPLFTYLRNSFVKFHFYRKVFLKFYSSLKMKLLKIFYFYFIYIYSLIPSSSFIFLYSWLNILVSFKLHLFKQLIFHSILDRDHLFPSAVRKNSIKDVQIIRDSSPFHLPWSRNEFL